jgi:RNA polymerase-binding transcription factor DksA
MGRAMTPPLTADDLRHCHELLVQRRVALRAALIETLQSAEAASAGARAIEVHDSKDDAFADLLKGLRDTEAMQVRDELSAIQSALRRIAEGNYGTCSDCDREIGRQRLLVQPSAQRCLPCQERAESRPPRHG